MSVSQAIAAPYVFDPFTVTAVNDPAIAFPNDLQEYVLTPAPTGTTYTSYTVSVNWTALSGDPYSEEANIFFVDSLNNLNEIYLDGTLATNGAANGNSVTLQWAGFFDTPYVGGGPVSFLYYQSFSGSSALWENVTITFDSAEAEPPPSTELEVPQPAQAPFSASGSLAANEVVWFDFLYTGGTLQFDTFGSLLPDEGFGPNDTELGLFDAMGGFIETFDDIDTDGDDVADFRESGFVADETALTIGERYYIALGGYDTAFSNGFTATSTSTLAGTYRLNVTNVTSVTVVPEVGTCLLTMSGGLLGSGIALVKRRRKSA